MQEERSRSEDMMFYYPIPAGAAVTCQNCGGLIIRHLDAGGGWRGCPVSTNGDTEIAGAHPVFLVSTNRRRLERRQRSDRRFFIPEISEQIGELASGGVQVVGGQPAPVMVQAQQPQLGPRPIVAGPRAAVYLATPGARLTGQTGHTVRVFEAILSGGQQGKTAAELRKELRIKAKSLESVLYRLRLGGLIRAFNAGDVRG